MTWMRDDRLRKFVVILSKMSKLMKRHGRPIKYGFGVQLHPKISFQGKHSDVRLGWAQDQVLAKLRLLQVPVQLQAGPLFRSWNVSLISSSERRQMNQMKFKRRRKTNFQAAKQWIFGAPSPFLSKTYSKPVGSSYLEILVPLTTKAKMEMEIILLHQRSNQQHGCTCLKQWSSFMGEAETNLHSPND